MYNYPPYSKNTKYAVGRWGHERLLGFVCLL